MRPSCVESGLRGDTVGFFLWGPAMHTYAIDRESFHLGHQHSMFSAVSSKSSKEEDAVWAISFREKQIISVDHSPKLH